MHRKALTMLIRIFLITGDKKLTGGSQTFSVISLEGRRVCILSGAGYIYPVPWIFLCYTLEQSPNHIKLDNLQGDCFTCCRGVNAYPRGKKDWSTSVKINFLCGWEPSFITWKCLYRLEMLLASMHCCCSLCSIGVSNEATTNKRCLQWMLLNNFQFKLLLSVT